MHEREHDLRRDDESRDHEQRPAQVAAAEGVVRSPRPPEGDGAETDERDAGGETQPAGEVVAGRAAVQRVVGGLDPGRDREHAEHEGERRAGAGPQAGIDGRESPRRDARGTSAPT